ncbi:MAG: ABC transporter permease [Alphaproteobacteria bacterium]|nr:ABC transporter permease [Alphaproteobacteria bacterium]
MTSTIESPRRARDDIINGFLRRDIWARLGWQEVKRRYRRTVLGPFWGAISIGAFVLVLGSIGSGLFHVLSGNYLPFLAAGMIVWVLLSTMISEGCCLFIDGGHLYRQMRFDYSILAYALVWRTLIGFAHNFIVYVVCALIAAPALLLAPTLPLAVAGLALIAINGVWLALLLGMFCLRFRDVQQFVTSVLQLALFATPVFWSPAVFHGDWHLIMVRLNPLYYFIEIVRAPLLGSVPTGKIYLCAIIITLAGWAMTYWAFRHFRARIAYWS